LTIFIRWFFDTPWCSASSAIVINLAIRAARRSYISTRRV
jgi:hypothetical protein